MAESQTENTLTGALKALSSAERRFPVIISLVPGGRKQEAQTTMEARLILQEIFNSSSYAKVKIRGTYTQM